MKTLNATYLLVFLITVGRANVFYFGRGFDETDDKTNRHEFARRTGRGKAWSTCDCQSITAVPDNIRNQFPLDEFYQKYTHAYGIPIISSNAPQDTALTRACYVVRFLLADRIDLRDAMYDSYGRVGVIGEGENTNDIPEHSYLDDWWNGRARGLGGTPNIPISTDGEENLRCLDYWHDRWWEEDVLVHEFSHAIHLISLKRVDSTFDQRLLETYNGAKSAGLWPYTYAISSRREYFAEGVQSFFDVQTNRTFIDNVHNNISTRAALKDYDRPLYNLIEEVYPCKNVIIDRCDDQDLAAHQQLQTNCTRCGDLTGSFALPPVVSNLRENENEMA